MVGAGPGQDHPLLRLHGRLALQVERLRDRKKEGEKESVCLYNVREIEMSSRVKEMKSDKWFRCCQLHLDPYCDGWIVGRKK